MRNKIVIWVMVMGVLLSCGGLAQAAVNSNSKILDGIEYYVQTDKSAYELGESVEMLYKITNLNDYSITVSANAVPPWNFSVEKDGVKVWQAVNAWLFVAVFFTLAPDESIEFPGNQPFAWNMHDSSDTMVGIGSYDVSGWLYGNRAVSNISVPIEIIPEPTTISFLLFSLPLFRYFERRKV